MDPEVSNSYIFAYWGLTRLIIPGDGRFTLPRSTVGFIKSRAWPRGHARLSSHYGASWVGSRFAPV